MTENTFYYDKNINDGLPFIPETNNVIDINTKPLPKLYQFTVSKLDDELVIITSLNMHDVNTVPLPMTMFIQNENKTEYPKITGLSIIDINTKPLPKTLFVSKSNKTEFPIIITLPIDYKPLEDKLPKCLFNREVNVSVSFTDNKYDSFFIPIVCKDTPNFSYKYTGSFEKTNIDEIIIPKSVEIIGRKAFNKCDNLKEVEISENCYYEENSFPDSTVIKYLK